ncbi:MAG: hypothetical protein ABFQ95_06895 [Pseudomonadota bacterium]
MCTYLRVPTGKTADLLRKVANLRTRSQDQFLENDSQVNIDTISALKLVPLG